MRTKVTEAMIGEQIACPECGAALDVIPFVCDNADRW